MAYDEKLAARVRAVLTGVRSIEERKMFGGLAYLDRGRMCVGVLNHDLVVRVDPQAYPAALRRPHTRPMDFTGTPLTGFLFVGSAGLKTSRQLQRWIAEARAFLAGLPPRKARSKAAPKPRHRRDRRG